MARFISNVQDKLTESSKGLALFLFKLFSGLIIGLTMALAAQEIFGFSNLVFFFVIVCMTGIFLRIANKWNLLIMVLFDLFAVVAALLLKMYVVMAP
ncbi:MAG: hypothetical protein A4S09_14755 [Proteobacteria bacterium SG_bin7]|nr:MAG: hypothetical protein A4S09_14755 [Proteobacteria bacterium SG_bin7]